MRALARLTRLKLSDGDETNPRLIRELLLGPIEKASSGEAKPLFGLIFPPQTCEALFDRDIDLLDLGYALRVF